MSRLLFGVGGLGILALVAGFVVFAATIEMVETRPTRHADGIVALTGGADRVTDALDLLAQGHADRLLITGVNPSTNRDDLARRLPNARASVACCVDLGYQAMNTIGNARETAGWAHAHNIRSLIVVTSNYHMPRAMAEIADALPGVELQAFPVVSDKARSGSWWGDGPRLRLIAWEYMKYVVVRARLALRSAQRDGAGTLVSLSSIVGER